MAWYYNTIDIFLEYRIFIFLLKLLMELVQHKLVNSSLILLVLYYSTIGTFNTVAFVICAILYCYLYDVEKNSMLNKSPTVLAEVEQVGQSECKVLFLRNVQFKFSKCNLSFLVAPFTWAMHLQVQDVSSQRQPHKSHYFLAGVGLTHIFVCIFFTLAIVLFRYAIPGTNIFEVGITLQLVMLMLIYINIDGKVKTYTFDKFTTFPLRHT